MSVLYMLDTDIASYLIKGRDRKLEAHFKTIPSFSVCLSAITRSEIAFGMKRLPQHHRLQADVRFFFKAVRTLCWDAKAADYYAEIRHSMKTAGRIIGEADMRIAAHALAADAILVTNNTRHFERIEMPLILENWTRRT